MRRCPSCGAQAVARARYCTACGSPLGAPSAASSTASSTPSPSPSPTAAAAPRIYAGVLVPPDPGPRPRRTGRWLALVAATAVVAGGAVVALRSAGDDEPSAAARRAALEQLPALAPPSAEVALGDAADLPVRGGVAVAEIVLDEPAEVLLDAGDAPVHLTLGGASDRRRAPLVVGGPDAEPPVASLPRGRHRALVRASGGATEVALSVVAVPTAPLGAGERVTGTLDADTPVVDVALSPGVDHAWDLVAVEAPPSAEVVDVTGGTGVADGERVCGLTDPACDLRGGHDYVVRVATADGGGTRYDLRFEDRPPTGGPGSVTFDGRDAPVPGLVGADRTDAYDLVVGVTDGVVVTVTPVGPWDPGVRLDGDLVGEGGPGQPDAVAVPVGRHTLVVGGGRTGGAYRVTVARR